MTARKLVERPDVVMIGIHIYRVEWMSVDEWIAHNMSNEAIGMTDADAGWIRIQHRPGGHESRYQEVLVHEILHALWDLSNLHNMDIKPLEDPEEFIVGLVSPPLLGVLKDNPHVLQYLLSDGTVIRS